MASSRIHITRWNPKDAGTSGIWGPVTASLDWCEANYPIAWLPIAEPVNTITNLSFIWLAYFGYTKCKSERLSPDSAWIWIGMALVGFGSFAFHGTLRYEWQLADELPMIYASSTLMYSALTAGSDMPGLIPVIVAYDLAVTLIYLYYPNPVFHQCSYALTVVVTVVRCVYLCFNRLLSTPEEDRKNTSIRRHAYLGMAMYLSGFALWNADNLLCVPLTRFKEGLGMPASFLFEGHGWWHILTGAGSHWGAVAVAMLHQCLNEGPEHFAIAHAAGFIPYVKRVDKAAAAADKKKRR